MYQSDPFIWTQKGVLDPINNISRNVMLMASALLWAHSLAKWCPIVGHCDNKRKLCQRLPKQYLQSQNIKHTPHIFLDSGFPPEGACRLAGELGKPMGHFQDRWCFSQNHLLPESGPYESSRPSAKDEFRFEARRIWWDRSQTLKSKILKIPVVFICTVLNHRFCRALRCASNGTHLRP